MRDHDEIDDRIGGASALLVNIDQQAEAALAVLRAASDKKDADGKLTKAALEARQRLRNPEGNLSRISVVVNDMVRTDKGAKHIRLSECAAQAKMAAAKAMHKAVEAEIALKAFDDRRAIYLAQSGSRKRSPDQLADAHEARTFVAKLVERSSPISILDQLSSDEMDFFHSLLVDKAQDPVHRKSDGAWHAMLRAGFIDFKAECLTQDERDALLIATNDIEHHHFEAMQALETVAGRQLDLSPSLAFALYMVFASPDLRPGVERLRTAAKSIQFDADINKLISLLGLEPKDWVRMTEIMQPTMVRLREEHYTWLAEQADEAERREALMLRYIPYVRLSLEDVHQASRADERQVIGADEHGNYDPDVALRRLQALPEEHYIFYHYREIRSQVRFGSFLEDCEAERKRELRRIAYHWADDKNTRDSAREKGVRVPEPEDLPDEWPAAVSEAENGKMDDMTLLQLPLTDEQANIIERKVYLTAPKDQVWAPAVSPVLLVVPVVPSEVVPMINCTQSLSEDEAQKLAERLFYELEHCAAAPWAGTGLPVGEMDTSALLLALRRVVLADGDTGIRKQFLAAVESGRKEQFIAERKVRLVKRLMGELLAGEPVLFDLARERGLLP